ncbi:MAG: glycoside hydrolase family 25 protein, partial [Oscillospiraceae bacterium]
MANMRYSASRKRALIGKWAVALACAAAICAAVLLLYLLLRPKDERSVPTIAQQDKIIYNNQVFEIVEGIEKQSYEIDCFKMKDGILTYDDKDTETFFGVDVSEFQDYIDWKQVKSDGADFAMLRVGWRGNTEGKLNKDEHFNKNIKSALAAGLHVGVYFYSQAVTPQEAAEEARAVIRWIEAYDIKYPVVYDWEYVSAEARTANVTPEVLGQCANAFCAEIEKAGYIPMIYLYLQSAYVHYNIADIAKYDFWLAEYTDKPSFYYDYKMIQYTNKGKIAG